MSHIVTYRCDADGCDRVTRSGLYEEQAKGWRRLNVYHIPGEQQEDVVIDLCPEHASRLLSKIGAGRLAPAL